MAISKNILTKKTEDGSIEYIYPKTSSDIVEYSPDQSVKEAIQNISSAISTNNRNIENIKNTIEDNGNINTYIDDLKTDITNISMPATIESIGLMSSEDKIKLDNISEQATKIIIDDELDDSSENIIKNSSVTLAMENKSDINHIHITVNEHIVESDIPVGAKFTDTIYEIVTNDAPGLMPAIYKDSLDNISDKIINNVSESDAMTYSSYNLNRDYYSKAEIDAIFAQVNWIGTLEDYNNLSIKNPRMIYTTIDTDGTIRRFLGDTELRIELHLIGDMAIYCSNGLNYDKNNTNTLVYNDITSNLKSLSTNNSNTTSLTLDTVCTNKGGLLIVFIMHQSDLTITGDNWSLYQTSQPINNNYNSYLSIYYKYLPANQSEIIELTQDRSSLLNANAIIYEEYDNLVLIENTSYPARTNFQLNKINGGMNIWSMSTCVVSTTNNNNLSVDDSTLSTYGSTKHEIFTCIDENGLCANTINISNTITNTGATNVLCMHLLATKGG